MGKVNEVKQYYVMNKMLINVKEKRYSPKRVIQIIYDLLDKKELVETPERYLLLTIVWYAVMIYDLRNTDIEIEDNLKAFEVGDDYLIHLIRAKLMGEDELSIVIDEEVENGVTD